MQWSPDLRWSHLLARGDLRPVISAQPGVVTREMMVGGNPWLGSDQINKEEEEITRPVLHGTARGCSVYPGFFSNFSVRALMSLWQQTDRSCDKCNTVMHAGLSAGLGLRIWSLKLARPGQAGGAARPARAAHTDTVTRVRSHPETVTRRGHWHMSSWHTRDTVTIAVTRGCSSVT